MPALSLLPRLFDPLALLLVLGGSFAVAALHGTLADLRGAFAALGRVRAHGFDEERARADLRRIERIARRHGILAAEHEPVLDPTLAAAVAQVVDGAWPDQVTAALASARALRTARASEPQLFWATVADTAPAMGMIGTIIGLVETFAAIDDPAAIGPAMALALLTTLYGAVIANVVAAPIAARLARIVQAEEDARARVEPFVVALAELDRAAPHRPQRVGVAA